jgi:hypothetical protein
VPFGKTQGRKGRLHRGFDDNGIARRQRRGHLAAAEHERMVEGENPGNDAERLAQCHVDAVRPHRDRVTLHFGHETREKFHLGCGNRGITAHFRVGIAAVRGIHHRQFIAMFAQQRRDFLEDAGPFQRRDIAPFLETLPRRGNRGVHVGAARRGNRSDRLPGARIQGFFVKSFDGWNPCPSVIQVCFFRKSQFQDVHQMFPPHVDTC